MPRVSGLVGPPAPMPLGDRFTGTPWRARVVAIAFVISDFLSACAAAVLAIWLYNSPLFAGVRYRASADPRHFLVMGLATAVLLVLMFASLGLYTRGVSILNVQEDMMLIRGFVASCVLSLGLSFILRDYTIPRIALLLALAMAVPLIVIGRRLIRSVSNWFVEAGVGTQSVAIYGTGDMARELATRIVQNPQTGLRPAGFFADTESADAEGEIAFGPGGEQSLPLLGSIEQLPNLPLDEIQLLFIAVPTISPERLMQIQDQCRALGMGSYYVPLFSTVHFRRMHLTFIGDIPLLSERVMRSHALYRMGKRSFDFVVGALLLLLLSPVLLLIALLIKLTSRGPVIFRQERIGQHGMPFRIFKFRTMHAEAPAYASKPTANDPRIFAIGRLLRRTSLDEFPQLLNVIRGEMSLVGPRPDMPQIVANYTPLQRERLLVPPGMTGLWQVSADRKFPIHENIDYDLYYIYNRCFLLDLVILVRTVFCLGGGH